MLTFDAAVQIQGHFLKWPHTSISFLLDRFVMSADSNFLRYFSLPWVGVHAFLLIVLHLASLLTAIKRHCWKCLSFGAQTRVATHTLFVTGWSFAGETENCIWWMTGTIVQFFIRLMQVQIMYASRPCLDAFEKLLKAAINRFMSVRPHKATRLPLNGFSWNLI